MDKNSLNEHIFLASANGYTGFKSYFDSIFDPKDYLKIFVLKGGPGTGKSSLMKHIAKIGGEKSVSVELFYCSSDPASLDGVVLEKENKRIAVIDGTAPHERDARLPGAIDEIVPLGMGFDTGALEKEKETIKQLNDNKLYYYSEAYKYLSISSLFDTNIAAEMTSRVDFTSLNDIARIELKEIFSSKYNKKSTRLVSHFSKYGLSGFNTLYNISDRVISISGPFSSPFYFLNNVCEMLDDNSIGYMRIPHPLNGKYTEAIYFPDIRISLLANGNSAESISLCDHNNDIDKIANDPKLIEMDRDRLKYLNFAATSLSKASDYHFKLEDIYVKSMNFNIVDRIREKLIERIKNYLSL